MSVAAEYAGWAAAGLMALGMFAGALASHVRLAEGQKRDRALLEQALRAEADARLAAEQLAATQLKAEIDARVAAEALAGEKLKGWTERLKQLETSFDRYRDLGQKVERLAVVMEGFGKEVAHAQEMAATQIQALAEKVADGQDRTDARFHEIREAITERRV